MGVRAKIWLKSKFFHFALSQKMVDDKTIRTIVEGTIFGGLMWGGIGAVIYILIPHPSISMIIGFATSGAVAGYMVQKRKLDKI